MGDTGGVSLDQGIRSEVDLQVAVVPSQTDGSGSLEWNAVTPAPAVKLTTQNRSPPSQHGASADSVLLQRDDTKGTRG
ncbi:unnamed protein product [Boreogadus saida]